MEYFERRISNFFWYAFVEDRHFTEQGKDYDKVKHALVDKFGRKARQKVTNAMKAILDQSEFLISFNKVICLHEREKLNEVTKSSFLKNH